MDGETEKSEEENVWEDFIGLPADPPVMRNVCSGCKRPSVVCWCVALPSEPLTPSCRIVLLQHPAEEKRSLRTASMLIKGLQAGRCLLFKGKKFLDNRQDGVMDILRSPYSVLLFPSRSSVSLQELVGDGRTNGRRIDNIVIIDGTWPQAKAIYNNSPALQSMQQEMKDRFLLHKKVLENVCCLLPHKCVQLDEQKIKLCCEALSEQWPSDLCDPLQLDGEMRMWRRSWINFETDDVPRDFVSSLNKCDVCMFPTISKILKIAATLPITTATAERSFSTLRRLKSYLRSTTSQSRLNGLAHLCIHRDVEVKPEAVLDIMARKPRKLHIAL